MSPKPTLRPPVAQGQFCFDPLPTLTPGPAAQAVRGPAAGRVTDLPTHQVGAVGAGLPAAAALDPADFAALRAVLETVGHFEPAPRDPPWADPRPDLVGDHSSFQALLATAFRRDGQDPHGVFGALVGIRCCGARLAYADLANGALASAGQPAAWRLVRGAEMGEAEYAGYRQTYLAPHTTALTRLLRVPPAAPRPAATRGTTL